MIGNKKNGLISEGSVLHFQARKLKRTFPIVTFLILKSLGREGIANESE
jgi:hypothetical protein